MFLTSSKFKQYKKEILNVLNYSSQGKEGVSIWCHDTEGKGLQKYKLSRTDEEKQCTERQPNLS